MAWVRSTALLASLALTVSCGSGGEAKPTATPAPRQAHVVGTFLLKQAALSNFGSATPTPTCKGRGGYNDIVAGMEVVLSADGQTLAVGRFSEGKVKNLTKLQEECEFTFEFDAVEGHSFYNVKVGRRGDRNYSFAELTAPGALDFTIGP